MGKYLAQRSRLYKKLLKAKKIDDRKERFDFFYDLIDNAEYKEIHFIISAKKELEAIKIPNEKIQPYIEQLFAVRGFNAFLMDLLEEARERKRRLPDVDSKRTGEVSNSVVLRAAGNSKCVAK